MTSILGAVLLLSLIGRSSQQPAPCKDGKFYEASVFDYINCSVCTEQPHYENCHTCCLKITTASTSTVTATREKTKLHTSLSASQFVKTEKMPSSSMEIVIMGFFFGFVVGAVITWLVVITARVCSKRRKKLRKLMTSNSVTATQETQLNQSSPMVLGQTVGVPSAADSYHCWAEDNFFARDDEGNTNQRKIIKAGENIFIKCNSWVRFLELPVLDDGKKKESQGRWLHKLC